MENQNSRGKKIIWIIGMCMICIVFTFFLSDFIGKNIPNVSMFCRLLIPVVIYVILGAFSMYFREYILVYVERFLSFRVAKVAVPLGIIVISLVIQESYFHTHTFLLDKQNLLETYLQTGCLFEGDVFFLGKVYQSGLNVLCTLLGFTTFSISVYNRIILILSAVFFYMAVQMFTDRKLPAPLFMLFFLWGRYTLEFTTKIDVTVWYFVFVSLFFLALGYVYQVKKKESSIIEKVISGIVLAFLFFLLLWIEPKSMIFILPAFFVFFSCYTREKKKCYWIYSGILAGSFLFLILMQILLEWLTLDAFSLSVYGIETVGKNAVVILVLNLIGFLGIYGLWNQKMYYMIPYVTALYFLCFGMRYDSGIDSSVLVFTSFVFYAAFGIGMLNVKKMDNELCKENKDELEEKTTMEIDAIRQINEKLNQKDENFVPLTFKQPKRQEKKEIGYLYEPAADKMKYDVEVAEDDDYDV